MHLTDMRNSQIEHSVNILCAEAEILVMGTVKNTKSSGIKHHVLPPPSGHKMEVLLLSGHW